MVSDNIQVKNAVILASGYGKRMRQNNHFPSKPMTLVNQKPLISYIIDMLIAAEIEKIYIVYHSVTADVLKLLAYSDRYMRYLEFIEEDVQKGTLLTFSRIKKILSPPFLMVFEDIMANKVDFINMLNVGKSYIASDADLIIQTVSTPSLLSEKAFLTENGRIVRYQKNGIIGEIGCGQKQKYGGMVYLWLSSPFSIIDGYLANQNYKFSAFLENYILSHTVYEMPISDMWDIDTSDSVLLTEEILKKRGSERWLY
ncbi:MAG: NTP transferase domain-containing protein [Clostridium sp.]|nr:NTP transferase domain-containing protein [Clostridium sp.]